MRSRQSQHGWTLLEFLLALLLLVMLAAIVGNSLETLRHGWDAVTHGTEREDSLELAMKFLRSHLAQVEEIATNGKDGPMGLFRGSDEEIDFVTELPERFGTPGLYVCSIYMESSAEARALKFRFRPLLALDKWREDSDPSKQEGRKLLSDVSSARFEFYGLAAGEKQPGWHRNWEQVWLPEIIRLQVRTRDVAERNEYFATRVDKNIFGKPSL